MSVFKRRGKDRGKAGVSKCYYGRYLDAAGIERTVRLCEDKAASEMMLNEYRKKAALAKIGIHNRYEEHQRRPLFEHLADFARHLQAKLDTARHIKTTIFRCTAIIERCRYEKINEFEPARVQQALADLVEEGLGLATANHYLGAIKSFARWLQNERRTADNPLISLTGYNARLDERHTRRALTDDEAIRLIAAARAGKPILGMTGRRRALCYVVALGTGLRANELRTLTWGGIDLGREPRLTVHAAYSKHREQDDVPLRPDVAEALRAWRRERPDEDRPFPLPEKTAEMIRADLAAAGIPYQDEAGRFADFHAQRHTVGTMLTLAGVPVKVVSTLMRHKTIAVTMDKYVRLEALDQRKALDTLPALAPAQAEQVALATGTDGPLENRTRNRTRTARSEGHSGAQLGTTKAERPIPPEPTEHGETGDSTANTAGSGEGIRTPDTRIMIPLL